MEQISKTQIITGSDLLCAAGQSPTSVPTSLTFSRNLIPMNISHSEAQIQEWVPVQCWTPMISMEPTKFNPSAARMIPHVPLMVPPMMQSWKEGNYLKQKRKNPYNSMRNRFFKHKNYHNDTSFSSGNKTRKNFIKEESQDRQHCLNKISLPWNKLDAEEALRVEMETGKKKSSTLLIKFPDPYISINTIKSFHPEIEKVHFQTPVLPRCCFIQLKKDADVDVVMNELSKVNFYNLGHIKVEKKLEKSEEDLTPEMIDPYVLYIGNLPLEITVKDLKEKFTTAAKISIGFSPRFHSTRYAFVKYSTVEESIRAFRTFHNTTLNSRTLIVRFRRRTKTSEENETNVKKNINDKEELEKRKELEEFLTSHQNYAPKEKDEAKKNEESYTFSLKDILGKVSFFEDDDKISEDNEEEIVDEDDDLDDDDNDDDEGYFYTMEQNEVIKLGGPLS